MKLDEFCEPCRTLGPGSGRPIIAETCIAQESIRVPDVVDAQRLMASLPALRRSAAKHCFVNVSLRTETFRYPLGCPDMLSW